MRFILLLILTLATLPALEGRKLPPLDTVSKVDLNRYLGRWYQFAYIPTSFQPKEAQLSTAEYSLHPKGHIVVKNTSYRDFEGRQLMQEAKAKAWITDKTTNAKLKVQFFWPFKGNYWIILLDSEDYQWAVVSEPSRKYLWILSRSPYMSRELYNSLLAQIGERQIDTGKIVMTGRFK